MKLSILLLNFGKHMGHLGCRWVHCIGLFGLFLLAGCAPPSAIVSAFNLNILDNQPGQLTATEIRTAGITSNRLWAVIGDFRGISVWHPWAAQPARYTPGDPRAEGALRVVPLVSGGMMQDRLLEWDGTLKIIRYSSENTYLPVTKFEVTLAVTNNFDGTSTISWSAVFDANDVDDDQAIAAVQEFFAAGLENLTVLIK